MRVLNFPARRERGKKANHRVLQTIVCGGETGDLQRHTILPVSPPRKDRTQALASTKPLRTFFTARQKKKNKEEDKYYLLIPDRPLRYFFPHFPLSLHSTEAPWAPPPLRIGPSSAFPPGDNRAQETMLPNYNTSHPHVTTQLKGICILTSPNKINLGIKRSFKEWPRLSLVQYIHSYRSYLFISAIIICRKEKASSN